MQHPTLQVPDVEAAVEFYTEKLGFSPGFAWGDPPEMAGVNLGDVSVHLQEGKPNAEGCSIYFVVGVADGHHERAWTALARGEGRLITRHHGRPTNGIPYLEGRSISEPGEV
jgi:catechol 2,3-dioxygenase-like lactoylglutathione lyase family enzyme